MNRIAIALAPLLLIGCSSRSVDPNSWTCENLIPAIIDMSKERDLQVLEITNPMGSASPSSIWCRGNAEWSQGSGMIEYGGHVSETGSVFIEYKQL